ncbi:MAG: hypothetical protein ACE5NN_01040 [Candidatus Bathyarchaeia archaeon]
MSRRQMQDAMDKLILEMLSRGVMHWSDLCRKVLGTHQPYATLSRFQNRIDYLLERGHIERVSRGIYRIKDSGRRYLESL